MTSTQQQRHIRFEGVLNFRDIGGYPAGDGGAVRWGAVYRSAELHKMTEQDARKAIDELGVRTVLDLRASADVEAAAGLGPLVKSSQVTRRHVRIRNDAVVERGTAARADGTLSRRAIYMPYVELAGSEMARAFNALAESVGSPVVFHCNQGRNRTGIMAALLLDALGVDHESIVADYALIDDAMANINETAEHKARVTRAVAAGSEGIRGVLAHLHSQYGGAGEYLLAQGLAPSAMQRIRERLIVRPPSAPPPTP